MPIISTYLVVGGYEQAGQLWQCLDMMLCRPAHGCM